MIFINLKEDYGFSYSELNDYFILKKDFLMMKIIKILIFMILLKMMRIN